VEAPVAVEALVAVEVALVGRLILDSLIRYNLEI
jgi:hypothetical protein